MKRKIRLTETELINLINNIINEGGKYPDNRFGIQQCKQILNNVPGTNAQWKQNFKQTVLGKPCNWVMNRYQFFGNKMQTVSPTSSAYQRYSAKSGFLECLLGCAC